MKAKDIMIRSFITIQADATIRELVNLINDHKIDSICVVEGANTLVGVVTIFELYQALLPDYVKMKDSLAHMISEGYFEKMCKKIQDQPVRSIMRTDLIRIKEEDNLISVLADMVKYRLMIVPVTREDTLKGVIHKKDLLSYTGMVLIENSHP
jgi:CBS domain-containing protein